ncbi:hypothetical protein CEXT_519651 [Caerostris extrusa]|uniref:Uncharacterized protein n=1 Tax=Caerostris extrusa TaxID=172846 RepID=A0AAV4R781_CAEEX|nr:hypothetical protein CEXT_519651 [Caerostris extrusa]
MKETRKVSQVQISSVASHGFPNDSAAPFKGSSSSAPPCLHPPFPAGSEERVDPSRKMKRSSFSSFSLARVFLHLHLHSGLPLKVVCCSHFAASWFV